MAKTIEKRYVSAELEDGTIIEHRRVLLQDQLAWSKYCRMTKTPKDDSAIALAFFAWNIATRSGDIPEDVTFKAWLDGYCIDVEANDDEDLPGEGEDPTPASVDQT